MYVMQSGYGNLILKLMTIEEFFNLDYPSKLSIQGLLKREEKIIEFQEQLMAEANYIIMVKRRISELLGAATLLTQQLRKELN